MKSKVVIKSSRAGMSVFLDSECSFEELLHEIAEKFQKSARFWGNAQMVLLLEGRALTAKQELQIVNTITEHSDIEILCLLDQDANRIERCEKALNQKLMELSHQTGQFYKGNLNRGESLESEASMVIIGDVCHGARVMAKGNVVVLGALRGSVYAGVAGNQNAVIVAMDMSPVQLKIADVSCHYGDKGHKLGRGPVQVCVENGKICAKPIKKSIFSTLNFNQ